MKFLNFRKTAAGLACSALLLGGVVPSAKAETPGAAEIVKNVLEDVLKLFGITLQETEPQSVVIPVLVYNLTNETQYWSATVGGRRSFEHIRVDQYSKSRYIGVPFGTWSDENAVNPGEVQQLNFSFLPSVTAVMAPDDKISFGGRKNGASGAGWYNIKINDQEWYWCGGEITDAVSCQTSVNKVGIFYQNTGGVKSPDRANQNNFVMVQSYLTKPDADGRQKVCLYPSLFTPSSSGVYEKTLTKSIWKMARNNTVAGMEPIVFAWIPANRALEWKDGCMNPANQPEQPKPIGGVG